MEKPKYNNTLFITSLVFVAAVFFVVGAYASSKNIIALPAKAGVVETVNPENTDLNLLFSVWNTLQDKSIHFNEVTDSDRIYGAIKGLTSSLGDPYTEFFTPKESKQFRESISGSFDGIGAELGKKEDVLTIIAPLKNSPAERAGLKSGDKILEINGISAADMSVEEAVTNIRGKKGTTVKLGIYREGDQDTRVIEIMRDTIVVPTIVTELNNGVFVIHIYNFGDNVVDEFSDALQSFKNSGYKYLVIDLRGNPGGYLESAVDIASYFVPKGKTVVTEDYVKDNKKQVHTSYGYSDLKPLPKIVVLVDEGSASASEILAGALRDHKLATIIGVKTFGKGSVQELIPMKEDTSLKVTIARWLTPSGATIEKNGISPDVEVKKVTDSKDPKKDNQLEKAIQVLKSK